MKNALFLNKLVILSASNEIISSQTVAAEEVLDSEGQKVNTESTVDTAKQIKSIKINRSTECKKAMSSIVESCTIFCTLDICVSVHLCLDMFFSVFKMAKIPGHWSLDVAKIQHVDGESRGICHKVQV